MSRVVTFGEIMLRLVPNGYERFFQSSQMSATFGGAEANVAVSLANFGVDVSFVTKVPDNPIGRGAIQNLRGFGVDTKEIVFGGDRLGIYFLEKGISQRASVCIYDRNHSAIQQSSPRDFDWDRIFDGAEWFHFTGITPALGDNLIQICREACHQAKKKGLTISCDLNYRRKLWDTKKAGQVMSDLCRDVDVCIVNEEDAKDVFGIKIKHSDIRGAKIDKEEYKEIARQLGERFDFDKVAVTLRTSYSASINHWVGILYDKEQFYTSRDYELRVIDRVGGGDSFGAGLIYSILNGKDGQDAIEFATAASALKHTIEGDFNRVSVQEVEKLADGNQSGRVER